MDSWAGGDESSCHLHFALQEGNYGYLYHVYVYNIESSDKILDF